ncbi:MAG TPA: YceI family protein [Xanthomonadaceae bacterium]|nr:YceI family protein [Xanthomonadaceae bacterium]
MTRRILLAALLAAATFAAQAQGTRYRIDPDHTMVLASWSHMGYSHPSANFGQASGTLVYDAQDPAKSSVEVTLPIAGLNSFVPKLDEHLKGEDFFDAAKYPTATFRSTGVRALGGDRFEVTGDLSLHGVTRPVVLQATLNKQGPHPMGGKPTVGFDATTTIKRSEFGIDKYVPAVGDEITLRITTEAHAPADGAAQ